MNQEEENNPKEIQHPALSKVPSSTPARIKVVGVGGGGNSAVTRMAEKGIKSVEFISVNTDRQALENSIAHTKVQIGMETTRGLGSGADPGTGKKALEENKEEVYEALKDSDMVFITAGMGGGTGSGALPGVAAISKELGALTIAVVTKPFTFEGNLRRKQAEESIAETEGSVDTLIVIPNDRLLQVIDKKTTLFDAFSVVDDVLRQGIQGISDLITMHGIINVDFADIKTIMKDAGTALMGIGRASGDNRAIEAARAAIDSPLLELSIDGAKGILFNITGSSDLSMYEIDEAAKAITEAADPSANIIFGAMVDEAMSSEVKITVIATGFDQGLRKKKDQEQESRPVLGLGGLPPLTSEPEEEGFEEPVPATVPGLGSGSEENTDMEVPAFIRRKLK
ncbi:cell division protein FtsZ [Patescibacteria group bacterium]|nr:cell division protein FtsZ [Patescibacteria group bacterium]